MGLKKDIEDMIAKYKREAAKRSSNKSVNVNRLNDIKVLRGIINSSKSEDMIYLDIVEFKNQIKCNWSYWIPYHLNLSYSFFVEEVGKVMEIYDKNKVIYDLEKQVSKQVQKRKKIELSHRHAIDDLNRKHKEEIIEIKKSHSKEIIELKEIMRISEQNAQTYKNECDVLRAQFDRINPSVILELQRNVQEMSIQMSKLMSENQELRQKINLNQLEVSIV